MNGLREKLAVAVRAQEGYYVANCDLKRRLRRLEEELATVRAEHEHTQRRLRAMCDAFEAARKR